MRKEQKYHSPRDKTKYVRCTYLQYDKLSIVGTISARRTENRRRLYNEQVNRRRNS